MPRFLAILLAFCASPALAADVYEPNLRLQPGHPSLGQDFTLHLHGQWPNSCVPQLLDVRIEGQVVLLRTTPGGRLERCVDRVSRYRLEVPMTGVNFAEPGTWQLRAFVGSEDTGIFSLFAFELFELGVPGTGFAPETGIWWPSHDETHATSGPGIGFALDFQRGRLTLMANVYDAVGQPTWLIGSGPVQGRLAEVELLGFAGGQQLFGDYLPPEAAVTSAQAQIEFHSRAQATLWVSAPLGDGPEILLQPIPIVRYVFGANSGATALRGRWELSQLDLPPLVLDPSQYDGDVLVYIDADLGLRLECAVGGYRAEVIPTRCQLFDDAGRTLATFDDVGLDGMSGQTPSGERVEALRLD